MFLFLIGLPPDHWQKIWFTFQLKPKTFNLNWIPIIIFENYQESIVRLNIGALTAVSVFLYTLPIVRYKAIKYIEVNVNHDFLFMFASPKLM